MTESTVQYLVAGALLSAWAWMLGRPVIESLFRRTPTDSIDYFRAQQAALTGTKPMSASRSLSRSVATIVMLPINRWRGQPLASKRLQLLMASILAPVISLILAVASGGAFVALTVFLGCLAAGHLTFAYFIGRRKLEDSGIARKGDSRSVRQSSRTPAQWTTESDMTAPEERPSGQQRSSESVRTPTYGWPEEIPVVADSPHPSAEFEISDDSLLGDELDFEPVDPRDVVGEVIERHYGSFAGALDYDLAAGLRFPADFELETEEDQSDSRFEETISVDGGRPVSKPLRPRPDADRASGGSKARPIEIEAQLDDGRRAVND